MTNLEWLMKNKKELVETCLIGNYGSLAMKNGKYGWCSNTNCLDCDFGIGICVDVRKSYLLSEHIEKPTITSRERKFLEVLSGTKFEYMAKDDDGSTWIYKDKPKKDGYAWRVEGTWFLDCLEEFGLEFNEINNERVWTIKELLNLEVCDELWIY